MTAPTLAPDQLWLPTLNKAIPRPWFLPSAEVLAEQRKIMESSYFLVNIGGIGEALICDPRKGGCGGKHRYITLRCVEQPFSGITGGLFAYYRAVGDNRLAHHLPPSERLRYDAIGRTLAGLPDLSTGHPETARRLTAGLGQSDALLAGEAIGILEPIPPTLARRKVEQINSRGLRPKLVLPGIAGRP